MIDITKLNAEIEQIVAREQVLRDEIAKNHRRNRGITMRLSSRLSDKSQSNGEVETFIDWAKYTMTPEDVTDEDPPAFYRGFC